MSLVPIDLNSCSHHNLRVNVRDARLCMNSDSSLQHCSSDYNVSCSYDQYMSSSLDKRTPLLFFHRLLNKREQSNLGCCLTLIKSHSIGFKVSRFQLGKLEEAVVP